MIWPKIEFLIQTETLGRHAGIYRGTRWCVLATVSKKWEISKKWEKVGLFCGANFQIIFENRQILDTQAKLESKIERCFD